MRMDEAAPIPRLNNCLNIFYFNTAPTTHENGLTRAFLVLLKNNPFVFRLFIDHVLSKTFTPLIDLNWESGLQGIEIFFQAGKVDEEDVCTYTLPIIISENEIETIPPPEDYDVLATKNIADGVICLKPNLALTIEVKRHDNVNWQQVYGHVSLFGKEQHRFPAVSLTWKDIVGLMQDSLSFYEKVFGQQGCVSGIERNMVSDFIEFLSVIHPQLMPFRSLKDCRDNKVAYKKYLYELLGRLELGEVTYGDIPYVIFAEEEIRNSAQRFYLGIDEEIRNLVLALYPADLASQGWVFYKNLDPILFLRLRNDGWKIQTNLHFAYMGSLLVYPKTEISVEEYLNCWLENYGRIKQYKKDQLGELYDWLQEKGLITQADLKDLHRNFDNTSRDHLNLCPGLRLSYEIPVEDAEELEYKFQLEKRLAALVSQVSKFA